MTLRRTRAGLRVGVSALLLCAAAQAEVRADAPAAPLARGAAPPVTPAINVAQVSKAASASKAPQASKSKTAAADWRTRRGLYFQRNWGVDIVGVRRVASGLMLRFDYRVLDPDAAAALANKKARPYLIDEASGAALAVPAMEKVGELRQTGALQANRTYFILFGNPGGLVKAGGRVTLAIGELRAPGLVVN